MTREEAKRVLEFDLDHTYNDESKEALRMAIQALSQEPCDDAISREDAIKCVESHEYTMKAVAELRALPSVTQRAGKWIEERDKEHGISKFTCSQCSNVISDIKDRITFYTFNRFCGRCGAKMVEPQESEE